MKSTLLPFLLLLLLWAGASRVGLAQARYESRPGGGLWSSPATWVASNGPPVPTAATGSQRESNNIIVINSAVVLDTDYAVEGNDGLLTINAGGSLIEDVPGRRLRFGSQQGPDQLRLVLNGVLQVTSLDFLKADAQLNTALRTSCNISVANQSMLTLNGAVVIEGNLVVRQGNPSIVGSGLLTIAGCVLSNNKGSLRGLFGPSLRVCVQGNANTCDTEGLGCNTSIADAIFLDGCRPLPVELVGFTARAVGGSVKLQWSTASEQNSASFLVERSAEGREFAVVATVAAAGNSAQPRTYAALDERPLAGTSYYRLRQLDRDGSFRLSPVVALSSGGLPELSAYGHGGRLTVELNTPAACQTGRVVRVLDGLGRVLYTEQLPAGPAGPVVRQVPLPDAGPGFYIVQVVGKQGTISRKVMLSQ